MSVFDQLEVGTRLMDEWLSRGTVKHVYPDRPIKGAVIEWDAGNISWPTDAQINKMRIIKPKETSVED